MQLTLRLKLGVTAEQLSVFRETVRRYTASFNRVCEVGYRLPRVNGVELHKLTYKAERGRQSGLPAQLVCSARVKATEALRSARALKRKGRKVSCPRSLRASIRYDARS